MPLKARPNAKAAAAAAVVDAVAPNAKKATCKRWPARPAPPSLATIPKQHRPLPPKRLPANALRAKQEKKAQRAQKAAVVAVVAAVAVTAGAEVNAGIAPLTRPKPSRAPRTAP